MKGKGERMKEKGDVESVRGQQREREEEIIMESGAKGGNNLGLKETEGLYERKGRERIKEKCGKSTRLTERKGRRDNGGKRCEYD